MHSDPTHTPRPPFGRQRRGFTLIELLVVIGIIALLVSIIIPVAGKIRISGQRVATQSTLNRISAACEQYFQDFGAYPGPLGDIDLVPARTTAPFVNGYQLSFTHNGTATTLSKAVTSSENLFIGLCGGLKYTYNATGVITGATFDQDAARQGRGPTGLNPNQPKKSPAYMEITAADISGDVSSMNPLQPNNNTGLWWSPAAGLLAGDSEVFEFVDRFRTPQPILYMRASRGAGPFVSIDVNHDGTATDAENVNYTGQQQYNPTQITRAYASVVTNTNSADANGYWHASVTDYAEADDASGHPLLAAGDEAYFGNRELSSWDATAASAKKVAQHKEGFILISAGPDGIYGTADDIRN